MISLPMVLAVVFLLILINGLFACMEIAVVSVSRARLRRLQKEKMAGASAAMQLQQNIDEFFATVQIGITFIGTLSSAIGGAVSLELFAPVLRLAGIPLDSSGAQMAALMGITLCLSYVSLIVGELVPKSLARRYPGTISVLFAKPFRRFSRIMAPAVRVLSVSMALVMRLLRIPDVPRGTRLTTEEFRMMAGELLESGEMAVNVHDLVVRSSRLAEIRVEDVMIPARRVVSVTVTSPDEPNLRERILATYRKHPFTMLLVTDLKGEELFGLAHAKDLLLDETPEDVPLRPMRFVPRGLTLERVLTVMKENHTELCVVVDEYGVMEGIITMEDILEEIVGEIESSTPYLSRRAAVPEVEQVLVVDGLITLHELKELHNVPVPQSPHYATLAGFLMERIGRIPAAGEFVDFEGRRFEVVEIKRNRVRRVRIVPLVDPDP